MPVKIRADRVSPPPDIFNIVRQQEEGPNLKVNVIACRCGDQSLRHLEQLLEPIDRGETVMYVKEVCGEVRGCEDRIVLRPFTAVAVREGDL
jgi:hypothetical protein